MVKRTCKELCEKLETKGLGFETKLLEATTKIMQRMKKTRIKNLILTQRGLSPMELLIMFVENKILFFGLITTIEKVSQEPLTNTRIKINLTNYVREERGITGSPII
jgi:hypothetical protein